MDEESRLNRVLVIIAAVLAGAIVLGSAAAFISRKAAFGKNLRDADPPPTEASVGSINRHSSEQIAAYTGLGTLRAVTSDGISVVLTPWLSYPEGDSVFYEELSRKRLVISGIFRAYFLGKSQDELLSVTEESLKAELLEKINAELSLGKIIQVYFTDYIFLN